MVTIISIQNGSTDASIEAFLEVFHKLCSKEDAVMARVLYHTHRLPAITDHPIDYPLVIYTKNNYVFCLMDVSAGYGGEGPRGTLDILKKLGFTVSEDDILKQHPEGKTNITLLKVDKSELCKKYLYRPHSLENPVCTRKDTRRCYHCSNDF